MKYSFILLKVNQMKHYEVIIELNYKGTDILCLKDIICKIFFHSVTCCYNFRDEHDLT